MKLASKLLSNIERKIAYRTYDRYTIVKTGLKPGYYDKDEIMLHACFALLVDFVEIELASLKAIGDQMSHNRPSVNLLVRLFSTVCKLFLTKRDERLGKAYLDEMVNYRGMYIEGDDYWGEIKELYEWWKDVRPARKLPTEKTGLLEYLTLLKQKYGDIYYFSPSGNKTLELKSFLNTEEDEKLLDLALKADLLQDEYDNKDDEMLLKLCRLRRFLWT